MRRLVLCLAILISVPLRAESLPQPKDRAVGGWTPEQVETMALIEDVGVALYRYWLVKFDACDAIPLPRWSPRIDVVSDTPSLLTAEEVAELLEPDFIESVPILDGWGTEIEYRFNSQPREALPVWIVRSAGSNQQWTASSYNKGPTPLGDDKRDIVWVHDTFEVWPADH